MGDERRWRYVPSLGSYEHELCALMDRVGYTNDDIEAARYLAAQGCEREQAAALLLSAKQRLIRLGPGFAVGMKHVVVLAWVQLRNTGAFSG